jgi:hypothetical protein
VVADERQPRGLLFLPVVLGLFDQARVRAGFEREPLHGEVQEHANGGVERHPEKGERAEPPRHPRQVRGNERNTHHGERLEDDRHAHVADAVPCPDGDDVGGNDQPAPEPLGGRERRLAAHVAAQRPDDDRRRQQP